MTEGDNGANALRVPPESVDYTLTIHHNVVSGAFEIEGWQGNRLVTIGMLEYALIMVRRMDAKDAMLREMENAPRVALPPGTFPQRRGG